MGAKLKPILKELQKNLMTGISYMMPLIIIAGVTMGVTSLLGSVFFDVSVFTEEVLAAQGSPILDFITWCYNAGSLMFTIMYPVFAGYISFGIADRPGLAPGFLGGLLVVQMVTGFLGAILAGYVAGYSILWLNKSIKINRKYIGVKTLFLLPLLGSIIVLLASKFVIAYIGIGFSSLSQWLITSIGTEGGALLSAGLGAARAFDFGGPVNKMAGTIGKQLYFDTGYSYIALVLGALVAPIGLGLSPYFARIFTKKEIFDPQLKQGALSCLILGFLGISEAVLPFIILYPVIIPISMIGTAVAGAIGFSLGASVFPGGIYGFYMWPLIENVWGFLIALAVGVLIVCKLMFFYRLRVYNKEQLEQEEQVKSVE